MTNAVKQTPAAQGMKKLPLEFGLVHFVGIGGIGMSGIAEVLHNLGYAVQGSDIKKSANTERLEKLGIRVFIGHDAENVKDVEAVVVSSAIKRENPEVSFAKQNRLPVIQRAEMLAEIMRLKWSIAIAGTHGKTTTTSLVGHILERAELDPTIINGGIINAYGTNTRLGAGDWLVAEADESDGSFTKLPAIIGCVTNIDPEHMENYGNFDAMKAAYKRFIGNIPFYGFAVLCIDHPVVQSLIPELGTTKILTYGFSPQADFRATNIRHEDGLLTYDLHLPTGDAVKDIKLPMMGDHNVQNSLVGMAIAHQLNVPHEKLPTLFDGFAGVKRRFTITGVTNDVTVVDDYGHHPVEIAAVLKATRKGRPDAQIFAVMQPHRYSRLHDLFDDFAQCFNDANHVLVTDVYAAGEDPIEGASRDDLVRGLKAAGHKSASPVSTPDDVAAFVKKHAKAGDMVICLGAGDITQWAQDLPQKL